MEVITKRMLIDSVAERYEEAYRTRCGRWLIAGMEQRHEQLVALPKGASEKQVARILGGSTHWTVNRCEECEQDEDTTVAIGDAGLDRWPARLCFKCLVEAVRLCIEKEPRKGAIS